MTRLLLTGATGTIGRRLVRTLTAQGHRPAVLLHHPERAAVLGPDRPHVTPVLGDYEDRAGLLAALDGVDHLFLLCPNVPEQVGYENAVIDAAAACGVARIVKISAHGAAPDSPVAFWRWHADIEQHLLDSGIDSVVLRPRFSMANVLGHAAGVREHGVLFTPHADAPLAMVDPQDVADVAAHLLTAESLPAHRHLDVSGPSGVTFTDLAAVLTEVSRRPVIHRGGTDDEAREYLEQHGTPPFVTDQLLAIFAALRAGAQAAPSHTVLDLLGHAARPVTAFLAEHADAFRQPALTEDAS
ncbi:MAG: NAD(P)H-binding protein [Dermatophilaceae bacterium]